MTNKEELIKEFNDFLEIEGFDKVDLDKKIDMILDVISPKKQIGYAVKESIGMIRLNFKEIGKKLILKLLQAQNQDLLKKIEEEGQLFDRDGIHFTVEQWDKFKNKWRL